MLQQDSNDSSNNSQPASPRLSSCFQEMLQGQGVVARTILEQHLRTPRGQRALAPTSIKPA